MFANSGASMTPEGSIAAENATKTSNFGGRHSEALHLVSSAPTVSHRHHESIGPNGHVVVGANTCTDAEPGLPRNGYCLSRLVRRH